MPTVIQRKQERARLIDQARSLIDTAEAARRDLSHNEEQTYRRLDNEIEELNKSIDRQERGEQSDRDRAAPSIGPAGGVGSELRDLLTGESRSLTVDLTDAARSYDRALSVGVDAAGGHTVPSSFVNRLYEHLVESAAIRQTNVFVHTTADGRDLTVPKTATHTSAAIVAEGGTIPEDDPTFGAITLQAFKYARLIKVSNELLTDDGIDLEGYLARSAGRAIGDASGEHFVTGTGTGQPEGALTASTLGKTAASATAITADEIIDMQASVIPSYRRNSYWMMNDTTWSQIRKLKDSNGQYLIGPLGDAGSLRLLGRPVVLDPFLPDPAVSTKPILFGDFSGYHIRQVAGVRFESSEHAAFDSDQTWFRAIWRLDGRLVDTLGALKHLQMAAA